ncbi:hypothetical protein PUN28_010255 [Cardiocondyla obscurior]
MINNTNIDDIKIHSLDEPMCSNEKRTAIQDSFKSRKECSADKKTVDETSSDSQCSTNDSKLECYREKKENTNDEWAHLVSKKKKNYNSPLVVNMFASSAASMSLPQIFEQRTKLDDSICDDVIELNTLLNKNTSKVVTNAVKPKHSNRYKRTKRLQQKPSLISNATANDKSKETNDKSEDVNDTSSLIKKSIDRESVENRHPGSSNPANPIDSDFNTNTSTPEKSKPKNVRLRRNISTIKPPQFYCIRNLVIVIMEKESRLRFTGKVLVKVLYGAVQIYGTILNKSTSAREVYSPRGYSTVAIETSEEFSEKDNIEDVWTALAAEGITRHSKSVLQIGIDNVRPGMAVYVLQNFENNLTSFLKSYFLYFKLFPSVKNPHYFSWTDPKRAEIILQANLNFEQHDDVNYKGLIIDPVITDIAEKMLSRWGANEWSCTLVAGGKNVGKSTTVRYLINSLLRTSKQVVLVDVDPGQAECTSPGCISYSLIEEPLMGPNFTHLKTPVYQLFIDDINVSRCVTRYLEGIKMLIERLKKSPLSHLPIVVNTMGFTQSIGWDIAIFTIKLIRPTIILQIKSLKKKNNYNDFLSAEVVNKQECSWRFCDEKFIDWNKPCEHDLCVIHSKAEIITARMNKWNLEPYQQRELLIISYFSDIIRDQNNHPQYNTKLLLSINEAVPYTAPFSSLCIIPQRLNGVPESRALNVINGNIVALCGINLQAEEYSEESESSIRVLTQRSPLCTCYGFGIIRGVDMERKVVFINTPLPLSMLRHVNCLAGCISVPPALLQLQQGAPYVGGSAELPTSREPRRGYFRMKFTKFVKASDENV